MSEEQYLDLLRRRSAKAIGCVASASDAVEAESDLHEYIMERVRARGWLAFHGSMAHRTRRTKGEPDFVILSEDGGAFFVECKSKRGKVTTEQQAIIAFAARLGHSISVISSRSEWDDLERYWSRLNRA
jgi:hypothetical protein